tara:strand:+ start:218 stop:523 length:306 start_codon:yes stop_codon:yes gene_type:complete
MKNEDKPESHKQYLLVGKSDAPSIANGNTWKESEIKKPAVLKVEIEDIHIKLLTIYDLSNDNWRKHWAAMKDGDVIMWIPNNEQHPFHMTTSGRIWKSFKE